MSGHAVIEVDPSVCMGTGACMFFAPETLHMGEDGIAVARPDSTEPIEHQQAAVEACPVRALSLRTERSVDEGR